MKRTRTQGFTIIEMVTVTAVVCIILAILWPVIVTPGREPCNGRRSCYSNLRQLGLATAMYAQDYDDTLFWNPAPGGQLPSHGGSASRGGQSARQPTDSFVVLLHPYVKNPDVFQCPQYLGYPVSRHLGYRRSLMALANMPDPATGSIENSVWPQKIGYGFNEVLFGDPSQPRTLDSLSYDQAEAALFADAEEPWASTSGVWVQEDGQWSRYWTLKPGETPRHETDQQDDKWQNFVFADGRAKALRPVLTGGAEKARRGYYPGAKLE
jgi:prepilin-type N-terminal cleavage/methylation domain-containing protein